MCRLLACCLLALAALPGGEEAWDSRSSAEDIQARFLAERSEQAAEYRLARARFLADDQPAYHAAAAAGLAGARGLLAADRLLDARDAAVATLADHPYAEAAPALVHLILRTYAIAGDIDNTRLQLLDLWERFPGYEDISQAMEEVLLVAETIRDRLGMTIDLAAARPADAVTVRDGYYASTGPLKLFYFLRQHGDRHLVAPRAALGIARCHLAGGTVNRDALHEARFAYDRFLVAWPDHPLVFRALLEQAVAYLLSYRGPKYDVGVLISAAGIIDQAEIYTEERPERIDRIARYRGFIRNAFQERDLFTASWYAGHGHPERARYYFRQVIARDPASPPANRARAALAELPPPPGGDAPLGGPVAPPAAGAGGDG